MFKKSIFFFILALFVRKILWAYLPYCINFWLGDLLWATMFFYLIVAILQLFKQENALFKAFIGCLIVCYAVEGSQSIHFASLDAFRQTTFGGLLLGHGFLWSDIIAYSAGAALGYFFEIVNIKS